MAAWLPGHLPVWLPACMYVCLTVPESKESKERKESKECKESEEYSLHSLHSSDSLHSLHSLHSLDSGVWGFPGPHPGPESGKTPNPRI